jgi:hypothetical protein
MATDQEIQILIRAQSITQQAFDQARKDLASVGQESQKTNQLLGGLTKGLGAMGIAFGAAQVLSFAKDILDTAGNIGDLSEAIGISTDAVQDFKFAAEHAGSTIDVVGKAIFNLNKGIGQGRGLAPALDAIGLEFDKIRAMSPEDRFRAVAEALSQTTDQAQRDAIGQQLLGKAYFDLAPAIQEGIDKMRDANKMSKDALATLHWFGDEIVSVGTATKNFFGEALAKAINIPRDKIREMNADLERFGISIEHVDAAAKPAAVSLFNLGQSTKQLADARSMSVEASDAITASLGEQKKALDEASQKAKQHAEAIAKLRDELSGKGAIQAARDMLEALRGTIPISKMTVEAQDKLNKVMGEARDVYHAAGKDVPDDIWKVFEATFKLTDTIPMINRWRDSLAHSADGLLVLKPIADKLAHETWPATIDGLDRIFIVNGKVTQSVKTLGETIQGGLTDALTKIPQLVTSAFTGGGGIGGAIQGIGSLIGSTIGKGIGASFKALGALGGPLGEAIGSLVGPLISSIGKLLGIGPTEYEKRMRAAVDETKKLKDELARSHGSMAQLIIDADLVGINIKEAFNWKDPEAFKNVVSDINAKTDLLNSAMSEYGFTWEDLGEKARGSKLGQLFDDLFAKTDILRGAGIDYDTILQRQAKDYSKLVEAAIRSGTEIPEAMRPTLEKLSDMGDLFTEVKDEQGNVKKNFLDLKDVKWSKSMTDGFKDVTDAIHELTDALTNGVGGALDAIGKRVVHPRIEPVYGDPGSGSGSSEDASAAAAGGIVGPSRVLPFRFGGFVPRGTDTVPAMLTPGEIVLNAAQQRNLSRALAVGGDQTPIIQVFIGNDQLDGHVVRVARKDAARGGTRTRATSGRSY